MTKTHEYTTRLKWDGNLGQGTSTYSGYDRNYVVATVGKSEMRGSADPMFRGDGSLHNPEDLFVAAIAAPSVTITQQDREQEALGLHDVAPITIVSWCSLWTM